MINRYTVDKWIYIYYRDLAYTIIGASSPYNAISASDANGQSSQGRKEGYIMRMLEFHEHSLEANSAD